jgi:DNA-binding NarL/FixJ family response regulator
MIRVFLADDHTIVRSGIKTLFTTTSDISVVGEAADGRAVLQAMETVDCDVLILDLSLPKVNGTEVLRRLREQRPKLPVLVLSMYSEAQYGLRMLREGASGYLSKDRTEHELIEAVRQVAQGRTYLTATVAEQAVQAPSSSAPAHTTLSAREYQVFILLAHGQTVSNIAAELDLSAGTVSNYIFHIKEKLGVKSSGEIIAYAHRAGLVD